MTKTELDNLLAESKRLDSAADSGPWATKITGSGESQYCDIVQADDHCAIVCVMSNSDRELDNAEFIALSRTALPALIAEVERLQRCLDQAVEMGKLRIRPERIGQDFAGNERLYPERIEVKGITYESNLYPDLYAELKAREK